MSAPLFFSSGNILADRRFQFATDLAARGDPAAAVDLLNQAVEIAPAFASAWFALGDLHERLGARANAIAAFLNARRHDPDDRHGAALRLARLGEGATGMPDGYVETLFDQYAGRFDTALLEGLAYRGPALLRSAVESACAVLGMAPRFAAVLDLGCGTGLAGAAFRDLAGALMGVDLSAGMLAAARAKKIYDGLLQRGIMAFLERDAPRAAQANAPGYNLVIAADVFAYFFDLAPVAVAVARVLAAGGLFAFTVETHAGPDVVLGEKLRFAHGAEHVRAALTCAGLSVLDLVAAWSRIEAGAPVPGLVVVARKP
jgi:predicted TPR repeat methyltransferase